MQHSQPSPQRDLPSQAPAAVRYMDAARRLDMFHMRDHSPGQIFWHENGLAAFNALKDIVRDAHDRRGYLEVKSPILVGMELFEQSGHAEKFRELMFSIERPGERPLAIRPMSCPNHISIYSRKNRSHADLPLRYFEFGEVSRDEPGGSLQALFRARSFCQDDSHVFCKHSQIPGIVREFAEMAAELYGRLGFQNVRHRISLRPEKRCGDDALWDRAENMLRGACQSLGLDWEEEPGGGAFYGPKLEIHALDGLGRSWQLGVIQLDFALPEKFGLEYRAENNLPERPAILHHAVFGSLERFLGILLELHGHELPAPVRPVGLAIAAVGPEGAEFARQIGERLRKARVRRRIHCCGRLGDSVRAALLDCPAFLAVAGPKEAQGGFLSVRLPDGSSIRQPAEQFIEEVRKACDPLG